MIYDLSKISKLFVIGDIHGDFKQLKRILSNQMSVEYEKEEEHVLAKALAEERMVERQAREVVEGYGELLRQPFDFEAMQNKKMDAHVSSIKKSKKKACEKTFDNMVLIACGDCGFGFDDEETYMNEFSKFNEKLHKVNSYIFFVRGNHDDPSYFDGERINLSNIKAVEDYSVIKTKNFTTLCVGGAISVDRSWRKLQEVHINKYREDNKKKLYWEDEAPVFDKEKIGNLFKSGIVIDSVVSHTAPSDVWPKEKDSSASWYRADSTLMEDVKHERTTMDEIRDELINNGAKLKAWCYGHFHNTHRFDGDDTLFMCLNAMDMTGTLEQEITISNQRKEAKKNKEEMAKKVAEQLKTLKVTNMTNASLPTFDIEWDIVDDNRGIGRILDEEAEELIPNEEPLGIEDVSEEVENGYAMRIARRPDLRLAMIDDEINPPF